MTPTHTTKTGKEEERERERESRERVSRQTEAERGGWEDRSREIDHAGVPPCVQDTEARPKGRKQANAITGQFSGYTHTVEDKIQ